MAMTYRQKCKDKEKTRNRTTSLHTVKSNANRGSIYDNKKSAVIVFSSIAVIIEYSCDPCMFLGLNSSIKIMREIMLTININKTLIASVCIFGFPSQMLFISKKSTDIQRGKNERKNMLKPVIIDIFFPP